MNFYLGGQGWFPGWEPAAGEDFERLEEDREVRREVPSEAPAGPPRGDQDGTDREPSAGASFVPRTAMQFGTLSASVTACIHREG
ncbi:hypothetical protein [Streptomyces mirabilis]|uniref:hypothetical protein n=1 Tax=Streptomyces mirabilis TaxID=68239 RepID=UPI0033B55164